MPQRAPVRQSADGTPDRGRSGHVVRGIRQHSEERSLQR
jgi:hypothetical protein